jgi:predicted GIY-YIG superfamily endonuclease
VHSRGGGKIVYSEKFRLKTKALKREAAVKKWPRAEKQKLIAKSKKSM